VSLLLIFATPHSPSPANKKRQADLNQGQIRNLRDKDEVGKYHFLTLHFPFIVNIRFSVYVIFIIASLISTTLAGTFVDVMNDDWCELY
jgi:hypothetical protein